MIASNELAKYREELNGWKLTALQLTPNGRFIGYERKFIQWVDGLGELLRAPDARTTGLTLHEFNEARRRINSDNDDLFPEVCNRLERTLVLAEEASYQVSRQELEDFERVCEEEDIDPGERITDWIRIFLKEKRGATH